MQYFVVYQDSSRETIVVCSVTVGPGDGMVLRQGYIIVQHMISLPEVKYSIIFSILPTYFLFISAVFIACYAITLSTGVYLKPCLPSSK